MKTIHIDVKTGKEIPAHEIPSGLTGFCSWRRLAEVFRDAKEVRDGEVLTSFQIDNRGITFRVT